MSIFAAPSFYNQVDQNIFAGGDRFIPQEQYRLGLPIQKNISFDSGITNTTAANMLPPPPFIPRQGGEGGGGISTTGFEEQSTTADDFGSGLKGDDPSMNMTQEEEDAINAVNNPQLSNLRGITTAGLMSFGFVDPITGFVSLAFARNKAKKAAEAAAKEAAAKADFDRAMRQGRSFYDTLNEGRGASVSQQSREEAGSGFGDASESGPFKDGGRVPYMMGGLTNLVDIYD